MGRLTIKDEQGNWALKGVKWNQLHVGETITQQVQEKIYGALAKLKDYEDSGMTPDECWDCCNREKVVKQLEKLKSLVPVNRVLDDIVNDKPKELGMLIAYEKAIEVVGANSREKMTELNKIIRELALAGVTKEEIINNIEEVFNNTEV